MRPLSLILLVLFGVSALLYAQTRDINDAGFVLSVTTGIIGALLVIRPKFRGSEPAGQVLLGIAVSLIVAASFGAPLVGGAVAGAGIILALNGRFR